jgi:SMI1/KNR4 family protein SUKH-1
MKETAMYLTQAKQLFLERERIPPEDVHGFTDEEVRELERQLGRTLPAAYREFLLWMGHGAGDFMVGTDLFYPWIRRIGEGPWALTQGARELLDENAFPEPLPEDAFTFSMHQGYTFQFFRLSAGDDPPVYWYGEGMHRDRFELASPTFSQHLLNTVEFDIQGKEQREEYRRQAEERRSHR